MNAPDAERKSVSGSTYNGKELYVSDKLRVLPKDCGTSAKEDPYHPSSTLRGSDHEHPPSAVSNSTSGSATSDASVAWTTKNGKFRSSTVEKPPQKSRVRQKNRQSKRRSGISKEKDPISKSVQTAQPTAGDKRDGEEEHNSPGSNNSASTRRPKQLHVGSATLFSGASRKEGSLKQRRSSCSTLLDSRSSGNTPQELAGGVDGPKSFRPGRNRIRIKLGKQRPAGRFRQKEPENFDFSENWTKSTEYWSLGSEGRRAENGSQRLEERHRRKLLNLLAQEYRQTNLQNELRRSGANCKRKRRTQSIQPKQIRNLERQNSSVFLDERLRDLLKDMGSWNTTQRGRKRNKVIPKRADHASKSRSRERSLKSTERSQRSVSFEKGVGRRRSSALSEERNPLSRLIRGLSPKGKKKKRRGSSSSKGSRKSSLSSRGSGRTLSRSSSVASQDKSKRNQKSRSSSKASRSRSASSSRSLSKGSKKASSSKKAQERPKSATRSKPAKSRLRSILSAGKPSAERKSGEKGRGKKKDRSEKKHGKSKKDSAKRKRKDKHYHIDEHPKLERVIFREDYEKKMRQKQKQQEPTKPVFRRTRSSAKPHHDDSPPSQRKQRDRPHTASHVQEKAPPDDYRCYRDPNIPGHAFPYDYLSRLVAIESDKRQKKSGNAAGVERIVLEPAPVNKPPSWRTRSAGPRTQCRTSSSSSPMHRRNAKTKSVINDTQNGGNKSCSLNRTFSSASEPRLRHGSESTKFSGTAEEELEKPKYPGSDNQLKNTDNPAILAWLRRKDEQLRARKLKELRKRRRMTASLIDEQNDLDDKHQRALGQYELWKKNKDREILLRRRKEAKEASSAAFSKKEHEMRRTKRKDRPRTANGSRAASSGTAFSELRSSSANPNSTDIVKPRKQRRPKSAVPTGVSFTDEIGMPPTGRPRSATPPRKTDASETKPHLSLFKKTENFFKSFLGVGEHHAKDASSTEHRKPHDHQPAEKKQQQSNATEDKNTYDKWVRSPSPAGNNNSPKLSGKKQPHGLPPRGRNKHRTVARPPPRNLSDNDLGTDLEKRRIKAIVASRKHGEANSRKDLLSGPDGIKRPLPSQGSRAGPTRKKHWRNSLNRSSTSSSSSGHGDEKVNLALKGKSARNTV